MFIQLSSLAPEWCNRVRQALRAVALSPHSEPRQEMMLHAALGLALGCVSGFELERKAASEKGSGASAVKRNDRNLVSAIEKLKRAPDPIAPSTTARGAVGRRQMRTAVYECDAPARFRQW